MPKSAPDLDSTSAPLDDRGMSRRRSAALALLAGAVLGGCTGSGGTTTPGPGDASPSDTAAALPRQPRFDGHLGVEVQAGLKVVSEDACVAESHRVCSVDRAEAFVPVRTREPVTLEHVSTHLADGHTSWTVVLDFAPASRPAVTLAGRRAQSVGGMLLVMNRGRDVLVAAPYPQVHGGSVRVTDLDKATAWDLVGRFVGG